MHCEFSTPLHKVIIQFAAVSFYFFLHALFFLHFTFTISFCIYHILGSFPFAGQFMSFLLHFKFQMQQFTFLLQFLIFTMVSYSLRWTLLEFFNSISNNHCQNVVRQLGDSQAQWLIHQIKLSASYCGNLNIKLFTEKFRQSPWWKHCKYKEWVSFFLVHREWTVAWNKPIAREPLRGSRFVCPALRFIPHEPIKK